MVRLAGRGCQSSRSANICWLQKEAATPGAMRTLRHISKDSRSMTLWILVANRSVCPHVTNSEPAISVSVFEKGTSSTEVSADLAEQPGCKALPRKQKKSRLQERGRFYQQVSSMPRSYAQEHSTQQLLSKYQTTLLCAHGGSSCQGSMAPYTGFLCWGQDF